MKKSKKLNCTIIVAGIFLLCTNLAVADIIITSPFQYLDTINSNNVYLNSGTTILYGALVSPNLYTTGMTGTLTRTDASGTLISLDFNGYNYSAFPDIVTFRNSNINSFTGNVWTYTFSDGTNTVSVNSLGIYGAQVLPFVNNVTESTDGNNFTFSWDNPIDAEGIKIQIRDTNYRITGSSGYPAGSDIIFSKTYLGDIDSFTIPSSLDLKSGHQYTIEIDLLDLRSTDGASEYALVSASNILSQSRTFYDFTTPVPEPTTILLFGTGLAGLAAVGRRKRN